MFNELVVRDNHVPHLDDVLHTEDPLPPAPHWPRQDCQLQDGREENPGQNSFTHDLRQSDKTQGSVKCEK